MSVRYNIASGIGRGTKMTEGTARQVCDIVRFLLLSQRKDRVKRGFYWENQIAFAFNSEKIEGSMLTEEQTRSIFETGTIAFGPPVPSTVSSRCATISACSISCSTRSTNPSPPI